MNNIKISEVLDKMSDLEEDLLDDKSYEQMWDELSDWLVSKADVKVDKNE